MWYFMTIETSENVSVVVSPVPEGKPYELGTPGEVGYKLGKNAIAPDSNREAELVNAEAREKTPNLLP